MKIRFCFSHTILTLITCLWMTLPQAQIIDCNFKPPVINMDFGKGLFTPVINTTFLPNYRRVSGPCPVDGNFSFTSFTSECFRGDWFTLEDHTPGDVDGNMMLVNASEQGGVYFTTKITGLTGNTAYEFSVWLINVCKLRGGCPPLPPNITIRFTTPNGIAIAEFETGTLYQSQEPNWRNFKGFFRTGPGETSLMLVMRNNTLGGCGNDFAMDDIMIRECRWSIPPPIEKPVVEKKEVISKPATVTKTETVQPLPEKNERLPKTIQKTSIDSTVKSRPSIKQNVEVKNIPPILVSRTNTIVKQIETEAGELKIDLYDNGEIDGDTVSVYHNNSLVISRALLSQKPVTIRITVDADHPHHELIMVANNLGSIPPNTSLMIITIKEKRYEAFISSSEQKNAKVVIDLKK